MSGFKIWPLDSARFDRYQLIHKVLKLLPLVSVCLASYTIHAQGYRGAPSCLCCPLLLPACASADKDMRLPGDMPCMLLLFKLEAHCVDSTSPAQERFHPLQQICCLWPAQSFCMCQKSGMSKRLIAQHTFTGVALVSPAVLCGCAG